MTIPEVEQLGPFPGINRLELFRFQHTPFDRQGIM